MARCLRDCYDSNTGGFFRRGEEYEVKAGHPLAKYFDLPKGAAAPKAEPQEEPEGSLDLT